MKQIKNILTVVALCATLVAHAKQVGKKTITNEPKPTPTPYVQPAPKPQPMPQPRAQQEYTNILNQLQQLEPSKNDWDVLKAIKDEVNEQMRKAFNPALAKKIPSEEKLQQSTDVLTMFNQLFEDEWGKQGEWHNRQYFDIDKIWDQLTPEQKRKIYNANPKAFRVRATLNDSLAPKYGQWLLENKL